MTLSAWISGASVNARLDAALEGPSAARLDRLEPFVRLALQSALAAIKASGLSAPLGERAGLVCGTATGSQATNEDYYRELRAKGSRLASPQRFAQTLPSAPAGEIAISLGSRGPLVTLVGLASGVQAVIEGAQLVARGQAELVVVTAYDWPTAVWQSHAGHPPEDLAGMAGAASLVLEAPARARQRGATRLGEICGSGVAFGEGASARAVAQAANRGGLAPSSGVVRRVERDPAVDEIRERTAWGPVAQIVEQLGEVRPAVVVARSPLGTAAAVAIRP